MSDPVAEQYEAYPYPARNPLEEKSRLVDGSPSNLKEVDHYIFAGRRDFSRPFRALVAGGGTGDWLILLAQNLADRRCPAEIVYLDRSAASRAVAEARATVRGLTNIQFHTGSLTELAHLGLGRFDYIDCCGVLHHLEDPAAGLAALKGALLPGGGMGLMVCGALGRTGGYQVQAMVRMLGGSEASLAWRIDLAKRLVAQLPETNWLTRNAAIGDYRRGEDAAIVDLLLHGPYRAYGGDGAAALVAGAGLEIVSFVDPWRYDPDNYLSDTRLKAPLAARSPLERARFAELLAGNIKSHICYVVTAGRGGAALARPDDAAAIPILRNDDGPALARAVKDDRIVFRIDGLQMVFALPRMASAILARIDGRRSLGELQRDLAAALGSRAAPAAFDNDFARL